MGIGIPNIYLHLHVSGGVLQGLSLRAHQTSLGLDTLSSETTPALARDVWDVVDAKGTDSALDTAGVAAWGSWYTSYIAGTSGARAQLRVLMEAIKRP